MGFPGLRVMHTDLEVAFDLFLVADNANQLSASSLWLRRIKREPIANHIRHPSDD